MRVVAGRLGGRRLVAPRGEATRPTGERVREALFSALGARVHGARVLDAFAGTGALGIEALSRGAAHATFVESSRAALAALDQNLEALDLRDEVRVLREPLERALPRLMDGAFDLVIADPPWAIVERATAWIARLSPAIAPGGLVVLEHAATDAPRIASLEATWTRAWGDTAITWFARSEGDPDPGA